MENTFKHYSDPSHGWVAVKKSLILELGIAEKISSCSYINGDTVYLEEDGDSLAFHEAFRAKFGESPKYKGVYHAGRSKIRNYQSYSVAAVAK